MMALPTHLEAEKAYEEALHSLSQDDIARIQKNPEIVAGDSDLVRHAKRCLEALRATQGVERDHHPV